MEELSSAELVSFFARRSLGSWVLLGVEVLVRVSNLERILSEPITQR
jgi:hypothetical protein